MKKTAEYSTDLCKHGHNVDVDGKIRCIRYKITQVCVECQRLWSLKCRDKKSAEYKDDAEYWEKKREYSRLAAQKRRREKSEEHKAYQKAYHAARRAKIQEERAKKIKDENTLILRAFISEDDS